MAVTVEAAFLLLDKASGTLKKIEDQAERTDKALRRAADSLDGMGTRDQTRDINKLDQAMGRNTRTTRTYTRDNDNLSRAMGRSNRETRSLSDRVVRLGAVLAGMGRIVMGLKIPAFATAIGVAGQAIADLAGGVVSLLPKLSDLGGTVAGIGPVLAAAVGGMATFKLALKDVGSALSGNKDAMKRLTPEARQFVKTLKDAQPIVDRLRKSAQAGLFPGLRESLSALTRGPVVAAAQRQLRGFGQTIGGGLAATARDFTAPGQLKDLNNLFNQGQRFAGRFFVALRNVGHVILDIAVAARPFTNWLEKTILGWTQLWKQEAEAGRRTGALARYFDRTKDALQTFGRILHNVWDILGGLFDASRKAGDSIWTSFERATKAGARWVNSLRGQMWLRRWFEGVADNVRELGRLAATLGIEFAKMGGQSGVGRVARILERALPPIRRFLNALANQLGPGLAEVFTQLARLLGNFPGLVTSPLQLFLKVATQLLKLFNDLLEKIPLLGQAISAAFTIYVISGMITKVTTLAESWMNVARAAGTAAVAERAASAVPGTLPLTRFGGPAGSGLGATTVAGPAMATGETGFIRNTIGAFKAGSVVNGGVMGGIAGAARFGIPTAARLAGKAFLPIAAIMGGLDFMTAKGNVLERGRSALDSATLGLIPGLGADPAMTPQQLKQQGQAGALHRITRGALQEETIQHRILNLKKRIGRADDTQAQILRGQLSTYRQQLSRVRQIGTEKAQQLLTGQTGFMRAIHAAPDFETGFAGAAGGLQNRVTQLLAAGKITEAQQLTGGFLQSTRRGAKKAGALDEWKQQKQDFTNIFKDMGHQVVITNDRVVHATKKSWQEVRKIVNTPLFQQELQNKGTQGLERRVRAELLVRGFTQRRVREVLAYLRGSGRTLTAGVRATSDPLSQGDRAKGISALFGVPTALGRPVAGPFNTGSGGGLQGPGLGGRGIIFPKGKSPIGLLGDEMKDDLPKVKQPVRDFQTDTGKKLSIVKGNFLDLGNTTKDWKEKTIRHTTDAARVTGTKLRAITADFANAMKSLGFTDKGGNAFGGGWGTPGILSGGGGGGGNRKNKASGGRTAAAMGARIPGKGLLDTVPVAPGAMAAPGELILNRHTENAVDSDLRAIGAPTLNQRVLGESRKHNEPLRAARGRRVPGGGGGGLVPGHPELHAGISKVTEAVLSHFPGLSITSTTGGSHVSGSYHYRGEATDIAGGTGTMHAAAQWIKSSGLYRQLTEGIHNPNLSVSNGQLVSPSTYSSVWAEHANHIHMAVAHAVGALLGLGGGAGAVPQLKRQRGYRGPGGGLRQLSQGALDIARNAGQQKLNRLGGRGKNFTGGGAPTANMQLGRKMMLAMGWPISQWPALKTLWMHESGWKTTADNPTSDAYGIPQSLPGSKMASSGSDWRTNPATQIDWGLKYIKDVYGSPAGAWSAWQSKGWYDKGGRIPWYGAGTDFMAERPQVIGVGDRRERVQVTPAGATRGNGAGIKIGRIEINNHRPGDIKRQLKKELKEFAHEMAHELEAGTMEDPNEVM